MTPPEPEDRSAAGELDPLDALASAHLDGLTSAADEALIASDPELQARVAAMERVRTALHAPVPVDEEARERRIGAALALYDVHRADAPVSDLAAAAARRSSQRSTLRILGIAAAVVLLVIAVPLLAGLADDGSDADFATSEETADEASGSEESLLDAAGGDASSAGGAEGDAQATAAGDAGAKDGDDQQSGYSPPPPQAAADSAVRTDLLDGVAALEERVAAAVLELLRVIGTAEDP